MSPQDENAIILKQLRSMGETMLDSMLGRITKQVELAEQPNDECPLCFGFGEYATGNSDSDWGEVVLCKCPAGRKS